MRARVGSTWCDAAKRTTALEVPDEIGLSQHRCRDPVERVDMMSSVGAPPGPHPLVVRVFVRPVTALFATLSSKFVMRLLCHTSLAAFVAFLAIVPVARAAETANERTNRTNSSQCGNSFWAFPDPVRFPGHLREDAWNSMSIPATYPATVARSAQSSPSNAVRNASKFVRSRSASAAKRAFASSQGGIWSSLWKQDLSCSRANSTSGRQVR